MSINKLNVKIMEAVRQGSVKKLTSLLDEVNPINCILDNKCDLLRLACKLGKYNLIDLLVSKGALVNSTNPKLNTPMHLAAVAGSIPTIKALLENGAEINPFNMDSYTPISIASKNGYLDLVEFLLDSGVDYNGDGYFNANVMFVATKNRRYDIIDLLHSKIEKDDCYIINVIHCLYIACSNSHFRLIKTLMSDIDFHEVPDYYYYNSNPLIVSMNPKEKYQTDPIAICKYLLDRGVSPNSHCSIYGSPITRALRLGKEYVDLLIEYGCTTNKSESTCYYPLEDNLRNTELIKFIIAYRSDNGFVDVEENHYIASDACSRGSLDFVKYTIETLDFGDGNKAVKKENGELSVEHFSDKISEDLLESSISNGYDVFRYVLDSFPNLNLNNTNILKAFFNGYDFNSVMLRDLFDRGLNPSLLDVTPIILKISTLYDDDDVETDTKREYYAKFMINYIEIALYYGLDINERDHNNMSLVECGGLHREIFEYLVIKGCDISNVEVSEGLMSMRTIALGGRTKKRVASG